jgi:hypothetical protein
MYGFFAPSAKCGVSDYETAVERIYSDEELRNGRDRTQIVEAVRPLLSELQWVCDLGRVSADERNRLYSRRTPQINLTEP